MAKTFRFRTRSRRYVDVDLPSYPSIASVEEEPLTGVVQDKQASAGEENLARALDRANIRYLFRHVIGAPKGLPGWKELDFLIFTTGLMYAVEVDSAFTHRNKQMADVLHDAIVLNDPELQRYGELYPQVLHVDGEVELSNRNMSRSWVQQKFGKG